MKKLIFTLIIAIALTLSIAIFVFWFQTKKENPTEAIQAIPMDATFILKVNDYHKFSSNLRANNHFWENLNQFTSVAKTDSIIAIIDTLSNRSAPLNELLTVNPVYISTHIVDKGNLEFLSAVKIPNSVSKKDLWGFVEQNLPNRLRVLSSDYLNTSISTVVDTHRSTELFSFTIFRGLAICATTRHLVELSIGQLANQKSLLNDLAFLSISHTVGDKVEANLFVNNKRIPSTFQQLFKQPYRTGINTFDDIANWSELDLTIKEDSFFLNGFTQAIDSTNSYLKVFARQRPVENGIASVLPSETAILISLGLSDLDLFLEDYRSYLDRKDQIMEYTSALNECKKTMGTDIHDLYRSFFNKEVALFFSSFDGVDLKDCWFVAIKTQSPSQTKQIFSTLIDTYTKTNKLKSSDFKTSFKVDKEKIFEIYRLPVKGVNRMLWGSLFSEVSDEYFTFIDDYIIFGASKDALSKVILSNIHNKQLHLDVSYRQFSNVLATESNFFIYINPKRAEKLYPSLFESQYSLGLTSKHSTLSKIQGIALQLNGGSNMLFNNICFQYSPYTAEDPQTAWETRLDTTFTKRPQLVLNHFTKGPEIIVQDAKNKLYLINEVGRILWKKQLLEPINGEITQVDLFKNSKLQYLFSTKNYIYAVDRKGEFVDGFPVKLKAKATNPVAVFDYDNNREYRFFIACDDRKIYAFDKQGKPISGWFFRKTEKIVTNQLQYFRVKGKDYIVFADANRPYIVDRKGEERISFARIFSKSKLSPFILDDNSKAHSDRLVTTDSVGLIKFIYFNGKTEDLAIKAFSSKHIFDYRDVDSDGENEYLFLDNALFYVYKSNKTLFFLYKFETEIFPQILNFTISKTDKKLGFVSFASNEIYLLNGNGSLYDGFPLKGSTPFSICNLSVKGTSFNVITGSPTGMLLNYSVK